MRCTSQGDTGQAEQLKGHESEAEVHVLLLATHLLLRLTHTPKPAVTQAQATARES